MIIERREFLRLATTAIATAPLLSLPSVTTANRYSYKFLAFDAFPIFDPRPVFVLAEELFPGRGAELGNIWRTRQFEYQWLRSLTGRYVDFRQATDDALVYAAKQLRLDLTANMRERLTLAFGRLDAWPEVRSALGTLKEMGLRMAFLSNMTKEMLDSNITHAGLGGMFERVLSTDQNKVYKPDPRAYRIALDDFGLKREEILFVAFAGWDAAGARIFGYPTFWVNRLGLPGEELGATPDATGNDLDDLVRFVKTRV